MKRFTSLLSFILLTTSTLVHAQSPERQRLDSLEKIAYYYLNREQWDSAIYFGEQFFEAAYNAKDFHNSVISAHICLGTALSKQGNYEAAITNLGQAHANAQTAGKVEETGISFMELYEIAVKEYADNLRKEKNQQLMSMAITALAIIAILLYVMYHQKSRLLEAIARQNHVALKRPSQAADEKIQALAQRLDELMLSEHFYREKLLTKERVAELLETNRTYLSQVINEVYGKTFTQYINDLRINEAIRLLDNPSSNRAIRLIGQDLGFNSPTTFNTQFQARTGMTPAQYRQKIKEVIEHDKQKKQ